MLIKMRKAQGTLEYAALTAIVVGALIGLQVYMKRGLQGKLKSSADQIGEQYSPHATTGTVTTIVESESEESVAGGTTTSNTKQTQDVTKDMSIGTLSEEQW